MTNIFSRPVIHGSFNIRSILDEERAKIQRLSGDEEAEAVRRETELEAAKNEYYEKGKRQAAAALEQRADEIKNEAYGNGYQDGKNAGFQELEPKYLAMKAIFDQWNEKKAKFLAELESDAVELALAIERKIVGYEIQKSKEPLKYVIKEAMKMVRNRKNLRLRVSREEECYFKEGAMDFVKTFGDNIEVIGDSDVNKGGCLIETAIGDVDAGLEKRWNMIAHAFFNGIERGDNDIFRDMFAETGGCESGAVCGKGDQDSGPVG